MAAGRPSRRRDQAPTAKQQSVPAVNSAALELLDHLAVSRAIEARQALDPAGATGESVDTPESAVPLDPQ